LRNGIPRNSDEPIIENPRCKRFDVEQIALIRSGLPHFTEGFRTQVLSNGFDLLSLTPESVNPMLREPLQQPGVYLKFRFGRDGNYDGCYLGESKDVLKRIGCDQKRVKGQNYPPHFHEGVKGEIRKGAITNYDGLEKPDTLFLESFAGVLITIATNLTRAANGQAPLTFQLQRFFNEVARYCTMKLWGIDTRVLLSLHWMC
jgi:hypothetical protein